MKFILSLKSFIYILFFPSLVVSIVPDRSSISQFQSLSYGKTIVSSPHGMFELGFFNLGYPNRIYLGIRYKNIPVDNVVWVANGGNPINDSSADLKLHSSGNLVLTHNNMVAWCTRSSKAAQNPVAELLDSGNLVIRDLNSANQESYLWQSFDYPSNTMLSGMKVGWDLKRNLNIRLIAWKSGDDPTPGDLSWSIVRHPYPEIYMMKGNKKYHRLGPWNGLRFTGMPEMKPNPVYHYEFVSNKEEVYYTWTLKQTSLITKAVLNQTALARPRYVWSELDESWMFYSTLPSDYCDHYGVCGANAYCSTSASPMCECLKGFKPKYLEKWNSMDWSQGCVLQHPLNCKHDGFVLLEGLKVPDTKATFVNDSIDIEKCRTKCLNNCSCMAYTNSNISGAGSGCVMWFGDLFDIKQYSVAENGQGLYIRLPASELEKSKAENNYEGFVDDLDLPLLDLSIILAATDNFSEVNKIGEGGFGPVYWGKLASGLEIAAKRLSQNSGQGISEFVNEVKLIAKLQHRNLVKLLGCCIHKQEKILVYEYMANGSLDYFIFEDRPTMTSVVLMLGSEMELDEPKKPGVFTKKESIEAISSSSTNTLTITLSAR
ncbi:G-type lectin S-receptor-like serine/threonine-protein kinase [Glycine soja]